MANFLWQTSLEVLLTKQSACSMFSRGSEGMNENFGVGIHFKQEFGDVNWIMNYGEDALYCNRVRRCTLDSCGLVSDLYGNDNEPTTYIKDGIFLVLLWEADSRSDG